MLPKNETYALTRLDQLINEVYHPESPDYAQMSAEDAEIVSLDILQDKKSIINSLRERALTLNPDELSFLIKQVERHLSSLLSMLISYQSDDRVAEGPVQIVYESIFDMLNHLFTHIEERYYPLIEQEIVNHPLASEHKVQLNLTGDQIGLLLRAAAETGIIAAKSISLIFRKIIPHLSSKERQHLSWNSMRGNSKSFEDRDKQVVLKLLIHLKTLIEQY